MTDDIRRVRFLLALPDEDVLPDAMILAALDRCLNPERAAAHIRSLLRAPSSAKSTNGSREG